MAIHFPVTAEARGFYSTMDGVRKSVRSTMRDVQESGKSIEDVFEGIKRAATMSFAGFSAATFINQVKQVRGEFQQLEIAFKTMLGSEQKANALMDQLVKTAATTPFDLKGVADGAKQLLAYGTAADEVNSMLVRLGDVAAGMSIPLNDLVYLYGTTMVQGRMFTQDLRQFQGRGIPIAEEIAKVLNVTKNEVPELVTAGKVTADVFHQAFVNMTNEGGKFGGLMEAQSKTILGQISNIEDGIDMMFNNIGKQSEGVINTTLGGVSYMVENWKTVGEAIGAVAVSIGSYKAVMIAVNAAQKVNNALMAESAVQSALAAAAGHTLTAAQARQAATEVLLTNARKSLILATKELAAATLLNPYVWAAAAISALVVVTYKLATAEDAATVARRKGNEEMEKFANQLDDHKNKINGYIQTLQDETATEYDKAVAWEMLNKMAPTLTEKYSKQEIATMDLAQANRELNQQMNKETFEHVKDKVEELRKKLEDAKAQYDAMKGMVGSGTATGGSYDGVAIANAASAVEKAQAELDVYLNKLAEMERIRKQVFEDSKPLEIKIEEANENVRTKEEVYKFYRTAIDLAGELKDAHDAAEGTIANTSIPKDYQSVSEDVRRRFNALIDDLETDVENLRTDIGKSPASLKLKEELENKEKVLQDLLDMKNSWDWSGATTIPVFLEMHYRDAKNAYDDSKGGGREGMRFDGPTGKWVKDETKKPTKTAAQWKADAYTDWKKAEKALDDYYKQKDQVDKETFDKKVEELQSDVDEAKKNYQKYGGSTSKGSKGGNDAARRRAQELEDQWKYEEEMAEIKRKAEDARTAASVAAIVNDSKREREERKAQHEQTVRDIELQEDEIYKTIYERRKKQWELLHKDSPYENTAEGSKGYSKKSIEGTMSEDEKTYFNERYAIVKSELEKEEIEYNRVLQKRYDDEAQAYRELLREYGSFEEQKLAITQEYEKKIAEEQDPSRKASLMLERDKSIENLSKDNITNQIDWSGIFSDLKGHTKEYLEGLRDQLQGLISQGGMSLEDMTRAQEKIRDINELIVQQGDFFSFVGPLQLEYNRRLQEEADAKERLKTALEQQNVTETAVNIDKMSMQQYLDQNGVKDAGDISGDMKNPFKVDSAEYNQFNEMLSKLKANEIRLAEAREKTAKATTDAKKAEDKKKGSAKDKWDKTRENIENSKVYKNVQEVPGLLSNLGLGKESEKAQKGLNGLNDAMGAATDFMTGNYIGALTKGVSAVMNFGEAFGAWSTSNRAEIEAANKKLADATATNTEAINRLTDAMEKQNPEEAYKSYKQALELTKMNEKAARDTILNNARMYDGGHSLQYDFNDSYSNLQFLRRIGSYLGKRVTTLQELLELDAATLNKLYDDEKGVKLLQELGQRLYDTQDSGNYNGMMNDLLKYMSDYSKDAYDELAKHFQESVTHIGFDTMYDNFVSNLMDMNKEAEDFAHDFEGYLRTAIYQAMLSKNGGVKDMLSKWYDNFAKAMETPEVSGSYLSESEIKDLMDEYQRIKDAADKVRDSIEELGLYDGTNMSKDKSATMSVAEKVTYDQMDEFTGILTAVQIAVEHGGDVREQILATLQTMAGMTSPDNQDVREIRNLLMTTNDYLLDIKKSNREILSSMVEQFEVAINAIKEI